MLTALAFGVAQALAGSIQQKLPIYKNHDDCAAPTNNKTIGTASVKAKDGTLTARVSVRDNAFGPYDISLYVQDGTSCLEVGEFGTVNNGSTRTFTVSGLTGGNYFIDLVNDTDDNETPYFKV